MNKTSPLNKVIDGCFNEIYLIDVASLTYTKVNQMAQDRLNYTFAELQQMRPWQLARDFTQLEWQRQLEPLMRGQQQISISTRHTCKNGAQYPLLMHIMKDVIEEQDTLIVVGKDLSFQQRSTEAHSESDARAPPRHTLKAMPALHPSWPTCLVWSCSFP